MTNRTGTSRRRAVPAVEPSHLLVEFDCEGRTYRIAKDREDLLRGEGRVLYPVVAGITTLEEDLNSGSIIAVNWSQIPVLRLVEA